MLALLGLMVIIGGLIAVLAPQVTSQAGDLVNRAIGRADHRCRPGSPAPRSTSARTRWADCWTRASRNCRTTASRSPAWCIGSLGAIGSAVVTFVLALVLCFFFLKDGPQFLPWLRTWIGSRDRRRTSR